MGKRPEWWLSVLARIWPLTWISARATRWPVIGPVVAKMTLPLFSGDNLNITYVPIHRPLEPLQSTPLPIRVGEELIRRASHRVIIHRCTCRDARQCVNHPIDLGCMLLGPGAVEIDPRIARHVSEDEAVAHLHRAVAAGLVPMAGRVKIDNVIWGVRDLGKLLTICYCCHCCCTILTSGRYLPQGALDALVPLKGLRVQIDIDRCLKCGTCVEACHMNALELGDNGIHHSALRCKGCGRCLSVCPHGAIAIDVDDPEAAVEELVVRIGSRIEWA
ncbi:MAG: 4Fe-4S binding protein [Desulfobacterales bacterium]|nr:4Fe-4S binding protein [Desulfobacterales bacterium]